MYNESYSHSKLRILKPVKMHLFAIILSSVAFFVHSSFPLSHDFPTNIESTHYEFGYQWTSNPRPTIPCIFSVQQLARTERAIYKEIRALLHQNSSSVNSNKLVQYVKDYEESALVLAENLESEVFIRAVAGNLVSVYRMVRRFRNFVQVWMLPSKRSARVIDDNIIETLKNIYNVNQGPRRTDLHISMLAFPLLQFQLDLKAHEIAAGVHNGRATGVKMTAIHCLEIGLHSVVSGFYPVGIEWIEHALEKANHGDITVNKSIVQGYLDKAKSKHDANWQPYNEKDMVQVFYEKPLNQTTDASQRRWRKKGNYTRDHEPFPHEDYGGLCKGDIKQVKFFAFILLRGAQLAQQAAKTFSSFKSEIQTSKLFCWYESSIHPFWKLGPLKSELLSPLPDQIVQFHDIIRDNFRTELRKEAQGKFTSLMLSRFMKIHPRLQHAGIMSYIPDPIEVRLENLAIKLSGLQVQKSSATWHERFELLSYIPGGFSTLHVDFEPEGVKDERLATLIIYLEEAEMGGSTGFPRLKLAAPAIKGSAILWFNVNSAGEHAVNAIHGACPVVIGSKFIAVKWISYLQQSHLKCDLNKKAGVDYLRNARSTPE